MHVGQAKTRGGRVRFRSYDLLAVGCESQFASGTGVTVRLALDPGLVPAGGNVVHVDRPDAMDRGGFRCLADSQNRKHFTCPVLLIC